MKKLIELFSNEKNEVHFNPDSRIKYLEKEEVNRVFRAIPINNFRDSLLLDLIYRHGLRRIEATWLKKEWISNGRIWIKRAKNGMSQEYELHPDSEFLINRYLNHRGNDRNPFLFIGRESKNNKSISTELIYHIFKKYAVIAGISSDKQFVHTLRHSIAVHLLNAGWDVSDVQDWLGHKDIKNTIIYAKISNIRRKQQFRKLLKSKEIADTLVRIRFKGSR